MAQYVFPKVEPADIQRSRRDLSLYKAFTASCGTLIPCLSIDMLPSDWMRINTIATVQSMPMVAPVRGRWKVNFDYFYNPWSNIYGFMDNNSRLATQTIVNMYRYVFELGRNTSSSSSLLLQTLGKVPCGGVLDYLGCPVGYMGHIDSPSTVTGLRGLSTNHPAEGLITYIDIVRNYYVNNQLTEVPYIHDNYEIEINSQTTVTPYRTFSLSNMDKFINDLRYQSSRGLSSSLGLDTFPEVQSYLCTCRGERTDRMSIAGYSIIRQGGLFLRNYRMDLLRGIMSNAVGQFKATVNVNSGDGTSYITMDTVYFANKLQQFINRIDITGGRFSDWIRTRWNIDPGIEVDRPIYLGSHSLWLNTIDVVATASGQTDVSSRNDSSVLGQQVGYQVGKITGEKQRPVTIKSKQYGTLQCIFSIVPDVVYSEGFELNMMKTKFADIYDPAFKQLGFQDVLKGELSAFPKLNAYNEGTSTDPDYVISVEYSNIRSIVGKRIAWSEYMSGLNRSHGEFANGMSLDYWVNNRKYYVGSTNSQQELVNLLNEEGGDDVTVDSEIVRKLTHEFDATTYVFPHLWNQHFANTDITAMNYMVDVYFQIDANRALGKRLMPHM